MTANPTAPYTAADKAIIERAVELLVEDVKALGSLWDAPTTPWTREKVDQLRLCWPEVAAVRRLYDERASAAVVAEQVAVARTFIGGVLDDR